MLEIVKKIKQLFSSNSSSDQKSFTSSNIKKDQKKENYDQMIDRKQQSMQDSQGKSNFSGSSYNGPGNVDHEKTNSNMGQRNF